MDGRSHRWPQQTSPDRTFEAVVFTGPALAASARPVAALWRRVKALCRAGVYVVLIADEDLPGVDDYLQEQPTGDGRVLLCATAGSSDRPDGGGLDASLGRDEIRLTDGADPVPTVLAWLGRRGVAPDLVLVIGDRFGPGDAVTVLRLLDEQVRRRSEGRVPAVVDDPAWTISEIGRDPLRHRVTEALLTLGAGGLATRGSVEEAPAGSVPLVLASGVYSGVGPDQHLLPGPDWTGLSLDLASTQDRRVLDLRGGLLWREAPGGDPDAPPIRTLRLASIVRPGVVALRAEGPAGRLSPGPSLRPPREGRMDSGRLGSWSWARVPADVAADTGQNEAGNEAGIVAVASEHPRRRTGLRMVERIVAYSAAPDRRPALDDAVNALEEAVEAGFDGLLAEQRAAWAQRWEEVNVSIPADPAAQLAVRFALFQLWSNVDRHDEAAVGPRGLSGTGYSGHVFWDADVYVLPAIASTAPAVARAIVEYRLRRLAPAQANARSTGHAGARFPWESAADGRDVTPTWGYLGEQVVPILTGRMEEHITADVAWAACHYAAWTGDASLLQGQGRVLLVESARYWASRCRVDGQGRAHIDGVIGPDEYHEGVSDNAYTNVMARWNLRRGADLLDVASGSTQETRRWRDIADRLVDGYDPRTGRYEQFAGYDQLEPLLISDVAQPPVAADVLLGRERIAASQIIKQNDVLMLHHLVPDEVQPDSLVPNLDFYWPRTAHGSSLSPPITAALLARAGRPDEALQLLRIALALDLEDVTGTTGAGLHLATMGGVWQAMLMGFAGVRVRSGGLEVDPVLPAAWPRLGLRFRCLGRLVRLDLGHDAVEIRVDGPMRVDVTGQGPCTVTGTRSFPYSTRVSPTRARRGGP